MNRSNRAGSMFLLSVCLMIVSSGIVAYIPLTNITSTFAISSLLIQVGSIFIPAMLIIRKNDPFMYGKRRIGALAILLSVIIGIGAFLISTGINGIMLLIADFLGANTGAFASELPPMRGLSIISSILLICVVPAVTEEWLFRGALLNSWRGLGRRRAIWLTAGLFTLMHTQPISIPSFLFLAYIMGAMAYDSRSVYPAMIVHFMNNLISLTISSLPASSLGAVTVSTEAYLIAYLLYASVGAVIFAASYFPLKARFKKIAERSAIKAISESSIQEQDAADTPALYGENAVESAESGRIEGVTQDSAPACDAPEASVTAANEQPGMLNVSADKADCGSGIPSNESERAAEETPAAGAADTSGNIILDERQCLDIKPVYTTGAMLPSEPPALSTSRGGADNAGMWIMVGIGGAILLLFNIVGLLMMFIPIGF